MRSIVEVGVGSRTSLPDVQEMMFLERVARGNEPFTAAVDVPAVVAALTLFPEDFELAGHHLGPSGTRARAVSPRGSILVLGYSESTAVWISAASSGLADDVADDVRGLIADDLGADHVRVGIWRHARVGGGTMRGRTLQMPSWAEVASNYPAPTRRPLAQLMSLRSPSGSGRLILWHGEPGTGKTSAVMALLRTWSGWCDGHVISDPEKMFEDPEYLLEVLSTPDTGTRGGTSVGGLEHRLWNLIVAEDADEYLRSDARRRSGPALGRLLNATDGILGRGRRTMILLTTNDEIGRLHPAVIRPGRCMALIDFVRFSPPEASTWLGRPFVDDRRGATLADLYQLRNDERLPGVTAQETVSDGAYL